MCTSHVSPQGSRTEPLVLAAAVLSWSSFWTVPLFFSVGFIFQSFPSHMEVTAQLLAYTFASSMIIEVNNTLTLQFPQLKRMKRRNEAFWKKPHFIHSVCWPTGSRFMTSAVLCKMKFVLSVFECRWLCQFKLVISPISVSIWEGYEYRGKLQVQKAAHG